MSPDKWQISRAHNIIWIDREDIQEEQQVQDPGASSGLAHAQTGMHSMFCMTSRGGPSCQLKLSPVFLSPKVTSSSILDYCAMAGPALDTGSL